MLFLYAFIYLFSCMYVCMYACMYVMYMYTLCYVYVCMHVCIYVYAIVAYRLANTRVLSPWHANISIWRSQSLLNGLGLLLPPAVRGSTEESAPLHSSNIFPCPLPSIILMSTDIIFLSLSNSLIAKMATFSYPPYIHTYIHT